MPRRTELANMRTLSRGYLGRVVDDGFSIFRRADEVQSEVLHSATGELSNLSRFFHRVTPSIMLAGNFAVKDYLRAQDRGQEYQMFGDIGFKRMVVALAELAGAQSFPKKINPANIDSIDAIKLPRREGRQANTPADDILIRGVIGGDAAEQLTKEWQAFGASMRRVFQEQYPDYELGGALTPETTDAHTTLPLIKIAEGAPEGIESDTIAYLEGRGPWSIAIGPIEVGWAWTRGGTSSRGAAS